MTPRRRPSRLLLAAGGTLLAVVVAVGATLASGILVRPTAAGLAALTEIPAYDVLDAQRERERALFADYDAAPRPFDDPYVVVDPYGMNPCAALALFETDAPTAVTVTVQGDDAASTVTYAVPASGTHHEVPILYLYAGRENRVTLAAGDGRETVLAVETEPLPVDFQAYDLVVSEPAAMEPGLTLCIACFEDSYTALIDARAQVRGYLSHRRMAHGTTVVPLADGHLLATGDEYRQYPYNMTSLWEFDWLGKVYKEYEVPNGIHHSLAERADGDFLAASNARDLFASGTREDVALVVDRATGAVTTSYDFRTILDETRAPYHHFDPGILHAPNVDWMHMNAVVDDPERGALIVSSPIQSEVVAIDAATGAIQWILGSPDGYGGASSFLADKLLAPVGDGFEWSWGQHGVELLPDADGNPDTLDLLLLDNGPVRSFTEAGAVAAADDYSRAVVYRIDVAARTVRQLWTYGKERGSDGYSTFLGDADFLPATGNVLVDFGGQLRVDGAPVDDILQGVTGRIETRSRIVEVAPDGTVVFEVAAHGNAYSETAETYQAQRIAVPAEIPEGAPLGAVQGVRLGAATSKAATSDVKAPPLYFGRITVAFSRIENEHGRLVLDGAIAWNGTSYLLARSYVVLRSAEDAFVFPADSGLNGRFFCSIDTAALPAGAYAVSVIGAVREGDDATSGAMHRGYVATPYKVTVE